MITIRTTERKGDVVAVAGFAQDWAAYRANDFTGLDTDAIIRNGDKLYEGEAEELFPDWAEKLSWRP